jgi:cobalt/nickel transport protein
MLQVDDYIRSKGGNITLNMPFSHPSHGGPVMNMEKPESLTVTHKGKTKDLTTELSALEWQGTSDKATAYKAKTKLRGIGDYVFNLAPAPYLEVSEDIYIQQFTKTILNVGGFPSGWDEPSNTAAEIIPDIQPYAVYAGGLFSGVVLANGKPKPGVEVEVEYLNHAVNEAGDGFEADAFVEYPHESLSIITVKTDENGRFFFGIPHAGYWGFAALGAGEKTKHNGKFLSQDAVLWVQAHQLKKLR